MALALQAKTRATGSKLGQAAAAVAAPRVPPPSQFPIKTVDMIVDEELGKCTYMHFLPCVGRAQGHPQDFSAAPNNIVFGLLPASCRACI